jgi:Big-like domain-containing protein
VLVRVTPESGSVNVRERRIMFEFDEVTNDRPGGTTAGELGNLFFLSPQDGRPRVTWRRNRIEVRPRRPFRPNTAYSITLLPGVGDLRGNVMSTGRTIIFSTGPTIPPFYIRGRVFDWVAERAAPRALLEVTRRPDSLQYIGLADSTGQFAIGPLLEGAYTVRAILDQNNNRGLDPGELWDSVGVTVRGATPFVELLAAARDTIAPRLLTVNVLDSLTLLASFDRPLDANLPLTPFSFRVNAADSTRLTILAVRSRADYDLTRARRDTAARDTTARDTTPADTARRARPRPPLTPGVPTTSIEARPSRRPPLRDVVIELDVDKPLQRGANYRVTAVNARGLLGHTRTSDRVITVPRAVPTPQTSPPRDTTTRRP